MSAFYKSALTYEILSTSESKWLILVTLMKNYPIEIRNLLISNVVRLKFLTITLLAIEKIFQ